MALTQRCCIGHTHNATDDIDASTVLPPLRGELEGASAVREQRAFMSPGDHCLVSVARLHSALPACDPLCGKEFDSIPRFVDGPPEDAPHTALVVIDGDIAWKAQPAVE